MNKSNECQNWLILLWWNWLCLVLCYHLYWLPPLIISFMIWTMKHSFYHIEQSEYKIWEAYAGEQKLKCRTKLWEILLKNRCSFQKKISVYALPLLVYASDEFTSLQTSKIEYFCIFSLKIAIWLENTTWVPHFIDCSRLIDIFYCNNSDTNNLLSRWLMLAVHVIRWGHNRWLIRIESEWQ